MTMRQLRRLPRLAALLTCLCLAACNDEQTETPVAGKNEPSGPSTAANRSDGNNTPDVDGNDGANDAAKDGNATQTDAVAGGTWGSIKGTFVLKEDVPQKVVLIEKGAAVRDAAVCAAKTLYRNDLVIDPETKGIQHIFIYLRKAPEDVHPDEAKIPEKEFVQDQKGCRFTPHTAFIRCEQKVRVISDDPIPHNTHGTFFKNQSFNQALAPKDQVGIELTLPRSESLPTPVVCDFHKHMKCLWLILDHPYAAITNEKGEFEIKNLPAGTHTFRVWHERPGYLEREWKIEVTGGKTTTIETYEVPLAKLQVK